MHNSPCWEDPGATESIDDPHRSQIRLGPPTRQYARIVEGDQTTGQDEWMPLIPIPLDSWLGVVTIYKQKINLIMPISCRVKAELLDPDDSSIAATPNRSVCRSPGGVDTRSTAQVKGVYQPERSVGRHRLA